MMPTIPCYAEEIPLECVSTGDSIEQWNYTQTSTVPLGDLTKVEIQAVGFDFVLTSVDGANIVITDAAAGSFYIKKQAITWPPKKYLLLWKFTYSVFGVLTQYYTNFEVTN